MAGWRLREDLQFKLKGHLLETQEELILHMNFPKVSVSVEVQKQSAGEFPLAQEKSDFCPIQAFN